jgi:type IV pilus assembly protein PilM
MSPVAAQQSTWISTAIRVESIMAKRATTLFIRDTSINLLVMKGEKVEKWASSPLEPGLVSQGLIVDEAQVADQVKQVFKEAGAKAKNVIVALSGHDSLYRIITLPELPEAVLPEAVRREAQRAIPTPLEEVYFSYQRLSGQTRAENRLFLATFPRNLVDALVRTLRQAGVKPYVMDLAPLALARIPNEPRAIIVNARLDHLDVIVLADRLPQIIRRLDLPGEADSLEERLPLIGEEFNRTVSFYNSSHMDSPLDAKVPVFVCGDLAESPDLWPSVVGGAGYTVSALPSPVEVPEGFNANQFMVNIGLALRELLTDKEGASFSSINFNALPEAYIPPRFSMARVLVPVGIVVGICLIVLLAILVLQNRANIETLRSQVPTAEAQVTQQQRNVSELAASIESTQAAADALDARLASIQQARTVLLEDLREIDRLAGETVSLGTVSYGGGSVTLNGATPTVDDIFRYARALRNSGRFSSVWISSITNSGKAFNIALTK